MVAQRRQLRSLFGKAAQLKDDEPNANTAVPVQLEAASPPSRNRTGLPNELKAGIESLSGVSLDPVEVHYNSSQPAQLDALAYAQGTHIHVAPGQERHLPHEAWHVVQQAQGRVQPTRQLTQGVPVNDDQTLEQEADVMGAKALQMKVEPSQFGTSTANIPTNSTSQNLSTLNGGNGAESGQPVQRVKRPATVTWAITHLVKEQGDSLFGEGTDWQSREVAPEDFGQLSRGQVILVDDEQIFMSRRGANQENPLRRQHDTDTDELQHKWLKVLAVWADGEFKPALENAYVRAETIKLIEVEKPPQKKIDVHKHEPEEADIVSADLERFHESWQAAARKRRRSIRRVVEDKDFTGKSTDAGAAITSGWNWDQYDEGVNVSGDMRDPDERTDFQTTETEQLEKQETLSASYTSEPGRIAYMVLEVRKERDNEDKPFQSFMYIRWLIADPQTGGGGSKLVKEAIERFRAQKGCKELRVDSAFSAVEWYKKLGFEVVGSASAVKKGVGYADTQLVYKKS